MYEQGRILVDTLSGKVVTKESVECSCVTINIMDIRYEQKNPEVQSSQ